MTTFIQFTPSPIAPFQFQAVLDGTGYNVIITWNVYRRGWYLTAYQQNGIPVVARALVASPATYDISLVAGYFTSTLIFREGTENFEVSP